MLRLGEAVKLDQGNLPLKSQVFSHYLFLRNQKIEEGEWRQNTPLMVAAEAVKADVESQWGKTEIPHLLHGKPGDLRVSRLISKCQKLMQIPHERRESDFGKDLDSLFDVAACQHEDMNSCPCPLGKKVPPNWRDYLKDQRGSRQQARLLLSDRAFSLRGGIRDLTLEEKEEIQFLQDKVQKETHEKARLAERKRKSEEDIALLFRKESWGTGEEAGADNEIPHVEGDCDDDSWEDEEEAEEEENYNTMSLKYFAREVDRYGWSDRGAAKIGNGLLKDLGLVRKGKTKMLICPAKVRRERQRWGRKAATEHDKQQLPSGNDVKMNHRVTIACFRVLHRWEEVPHTGQGCDRDKSEGARS